MNRKLKIRKMSPAREVASRGRSVHDAQGKGLAGAAPEDPTIDLDIVQDEQTFSAH